jgi:hypothetical protein
MTPRKMMISGWVIDELSIDLVFGFLGRGWGTPIPCDVSVSVAAHDSFSCLSISALILVSFLCHAMYRSWPFSSFFTNSPPIHPIAPGTALRETIPYVS